VKRIGSSRTVPVPTTCIDHCRLLPNCELLTECIANVLHIIIDERNVVFDDDDRIVLKRVACFDVSDRPSAITEFILIEIARIGPVRQITIERTERRRGEGEGGGGGDEQVRRGNGTSQHAMSYAE
jgi:hypothetical protein